MISWLGLNRRAVLLVSTAVLLNGCLSNTSPPAATATLTYPAPTQTIAIYPATLTPASATPAATLPVLSPPPAGPAASTAALTPQVTKQAVSAPAATNSPPVIDSFTSDRFEVEPGGTVTLSWSSQGGTAAEITAEFYRVGSTERLEERHNVPISGTLAIRMPDTPVRQASFLLHVSTPTNEYANQSVYVHSPCAARYFFPFPESWRGTALDNCPDQGPTTVQAVQQDFERGRMIWLPSNLGGASQPLIAVLAGSGAGPEWNIHCLMDDTWQEGEPESDPAIVPPAGLYQPVRGFGKLWREREREHLGWALAPEQSYFAQYQAGDAVWSPDNDSYIYISTADNRTVLIHCVRLKLYWQYVP